MATPSKTENVAIPKNLHDWLKQHKARTGLPITIIVTQAVQALKDKRKAKP